MTIENAVVYDLINHRTLCDLILPEAPDSAVYSCADIITDYFDLDKISEQAKFDFERYKILCEKNLSTEEKAN
jgi:hypothetical protein